VKPEEFKSRTKALGLATIRLVESLPRRPARRILGEQLLRSATSVGANYRAACRGRSAAEVIAKMSIVLEEADETAYWLETLSEAGLVPPAKLNPLLTESNEIVTMIVASLKTLQLRYGRGARPSPCPQSSI
jgi:four helix bundle protein